MAVIDKDRPIESLREKVIDKLIMNYSHGELSLEAFERRLDQAMDTSEHSVLISLTADLELSVDQEFIDNKEEQQNTNYVSSDADSEDIEYIVQIFAGNERNGTWVLPKEIRIFSLFSGAALDLTEAQFAHPTLRIMVFSLFSGNDIFVADNVNVRTNAFSIFGGISNKALSNANHNSPTVLIEGVGIFSGINIKVKRSIKERFVIFADKLKTMLS
ncbi:MAG: DUF1707 and DUF2154 domain-containing protein [Gammaproteobacteria bacterium]|nr:DUF1707 and DUF2154 domain-containing protein [Gammaproteobacteria bacterium]